MKEIQLANSPLMVTVDDDDYESLSRYTWRTNSDGRYAIRGKLDQKAKRCRIILMHRVINKTPIGKITDHINHNTLDNRKQNLRTVTLSQNSANMRIHKKPKTSRFKGVCRWLSGGRERWQAGIKINYVRISLGKFDTQEEAALAYNEAAKRLFGEFAYLNPI